jgi:hypothetical protein
MPLTELVYCVAVAFTLSSLSTGILALGKTKSHGDPNLGCRGADRHGWCNVLPKKPAHSCRMGRCTDANSLICSFSHCECDGHTVHKLSQQCLTADWPAPREGDSSRMRSEVSSDWLPSYVKATRPALEIFEMVECLPDRSHIWPSHWTPSAFCTMQ